MKTVMKKPHQLCEGDKILGNNNWYKITKLTYNGIAGSLFPVIVIEDSHKNVKTIDTGGNPRLQDHLYECECSQ